jgi:diguanylate cyclase (GGDEF)-like protein/PAS domain S-box-containing protein
MNEMQLGHHRNERVDREATVRTTKRAQHGDGETPAGSPGNVIRVLMLEDVEADAALIEREFLRSGIPVEAHRVEDQEAFLRELDSFAPDLILADYSLPRYDGLSALDVVLRLHPEIPFIFVSGTMGEEFAIEGLKRGATDYVLKNRLSGLVPSVRRALREAEQYEKRKMVERALSESERKFRMLFNGANDAITVRDLGEQAAPGKFIEVNDVACRQLGYTKEELLKFSTEKVASLEQADGLESFMSRLKTDKYVLYEAVRLGKKVGKIPVEINAHLVELNGQLAILSIARDITERKRDEEKLRKANRALKTLSECNQLQVRASDEQSLLRNICRVIVEAGGYRLAWVGFSEKGGEKGIRIAARAGTDDDVPERVTFIDPSTGRAHPAFAALRSGTLAVARDIKTIPKGDPWRDAALDRGHRSALALPLAIDGNATGVLSIFAGAPDAFDEKEVELLSEMADDLTYGIRAFRTAAERTRADEALQESEKRYKRLIESVTDYIYNVRVEDGVPVKTVHSPSCIAVTGYSSEEYEADPHLWFRMVHEEDREAVMNQSKIVLSGWAAAALEHRIIHKNGAVRWVKNTPVPRYDERQRLLSYDGLVVDITERKLAEHKLKHVAYYDSLTDLPNRELFSDRLRQAQIQARRHGSMLAVMFLDLDRFKSINDTLGHTIGDLLLRSVSERLLHCVREGDTVARLGGDEFIILLADMTQAQAATTVAKKIHGALLKSFALSGQEFFITTSIGISLFPSDGADADTLIKNADLAMYQAKAQGRNNYQFYTPAMNAGSLRRLVLESNLRKALEREEFILHYQPVVELSSGRITGTEALVRWQHPELGLLHPVEFIPLAEETGLIIPLGGWILEKVCIQAKAWQKSGFSPIRMSVNLSMRQFTHNAVTGTVSKALEKSDLDPGLLELELTESAVMQNAKQTIAALHELKSTGIQLSLDDFGTGYSSLSYLKNLPLNKLKLDQSFVNSLARQSTNEAISKAIIGLAHSLNLQVIAEGVETVDQLELLRSLRCDEVQGYLFSRPMPAEEMTRLVKEERAVCSNRHFPQTAPVWNDPPARC